jgi:chemotaxis protein MotB
LARKKREEAPSGGNAPWLNTFADLMNLLLCFFVLLFAMSTVDAEKFEQITNSFTSTFSIFSGGGSAIREGQLISSGMYQLNNLDEYYSSMGEASSESEEEDSGATDSEDKKNTSEASSDLTTDEAMEQIKEESKELSEGMYDDISDLTDQSNLTDYLEVSMDPEYQFVQLSLRGSILFDSGEAGIKEEAIPIFSKLGDLLKQYEDFTIEIEGHTDNVPISNSKYLNNNWLSSARALSAAEYLIQNKGFDPSRLKYSGRGEYEPITNNSTAEGRAKNRRIEIKIYNELSGR